VVSSGFLALRSMRFLLELRSLINFVGTQDLING